MTVSIPVSLGPPAASVARRGAVTLPLGGVGGRLGAVGRREARILRAVAAAAPIARPRRALEVAREVRDDPGASFDNVVVNELNPVLEKIAQAMQDRSGAPTPTDVERAVAREIGADPVLVAAASSVVKDSDPAADASLYWVASVNLDLHERATRAAVREKLLDTIPSEQSQARIDQVEAKVSGLDTRLTDLNTRVERLEGRTPPTKSTQK
jgi:hypothetical protein